MIGKGGWAAGATDFNQGCGKSLNSHGKGRKWQIKLSRNSRDEDFRPSVATVWLYYLEQDYLLENHLVVQ